MILSAASFEPVLICDSAGELNFDVEVLQSCIRRIFEDDSLDELYWYLSGTTDTEEEQRYEVSQSTSDEESSLCIMPPNESRAKNWCFTLNNFSPEDEERLRVLGDGDTVTYLCFGREVGESGTPHLQGFVSFVERTRFSNVIEAIGQAHLTVTRSVQQSIKYCQKDGDFETFGVEPKGVGNRADIDLFKEAVKDGCLSLSVLRENHSTLFARSPRFCVEYVNDNLPTIKKDVHPLYEWQQRLYGELILPADDRKIVFIVDRRGNSGKSWFSHYYCGIHENGQVILPGRKADMAFALRSDIKVLFVDAPRSKQGDFIQYDFLEDVKNGYVFSTKYESRVKTLAACHIVVNMNEMPDMAKLSGDRYDIREINI